MRRNWVLPEGFPSRAVAEAYLRPLVDHSEAPLAWARPNLHGLRAFCADKFGWTQPKADELLLPMLAELDKGTTQTRLDQHYAWSKKFARYGSSRLANAVQMQNGGKAHPNGSPALLGSAGGAGGAGGAPADEKEGESGDEFGGAVPSGASDERPAPPAKAKAASASRKRKAKAPPKEPGGGGQRKK